jgi:hypothetical protein
MQKVRDSENKSFWNRSIPTHTNAKTCIQITSFFVEMSSPLDGFSEQHPDHWEILTPKDQEGYVVLRERLGYFALRVHRPQLGANFGKMLNAIENYTICHDCNDWKRCVVCGLSRLSKDSYAINTRQLCKLMNKCRSSVNFGFQAFGYTTVSMSAAHALQLTQFFPFLRENCLEMRQWTIREALNDGFPVESIDEATPSSIETQPNAAQEDEPTDCFSIEPDRSDFADDETQWIVFDSDDITGY